MKSISPESTVTLFFEISMQDQSIVDSNFEQQPATFKIGDGNMLAGFESVLIGLVVGDKKQFSLKPEQAFGMKNPSNFQTIPMSRFTDIELEEGLVISFQDPSGELPGVISSFDDKEAVVDFNHPLAGQELEFRVEIIEIS